MVFELRRESGAQGQVEETAAAPQQTQGAEVAAPAGLSASPFLEHPLFAAALAGRCLLRRGNCDGAVTSILQTALTGLGYDPGVVDGLWGANTQSALVGAQQALGCAADGIIGPETMGALDTASAGMGVGGTGATSGAIESKLGRQVVKSGDDYVDPDRQGQNHADVLPFTPTGWDGATILKRWTQVDKLDFTLSDEHRCSANAILASRIMVGPNELIGLLKPIMIQGDAMANGGVADMRMHTDILMLGAFAIINRTATWFLLDAIANSLKAIALGGADGPALGYEVDMVHKKAANTPADGLHNAVPSNMGDIAFYLAALRPKMAWTVNVDSNEMVAGQAKSPDDMDHFVTVGQDASGLIYLYDPWPRAGSQLIYQSAEPDVFKAYFVDSKTGRMRQSEWLSRTTPQA